MTFWFSRTNDPHRALGVLGPLEWNVLEALWKREAPASVRDLTPDFTDIAYTTLMTTLDRLHRKGILEREKLGRAFVYRPRLTRTEFQSARAGDAVRAALRNGGSLAPLASYLVDAVGDRDRELLDQLEALVAQRRAEARQKS
ncbi:MAG TPA: BlaI/MecI/CopY family transcriptional regulator [Vicinamibacterales bacterium]|nr:BlaI/MecI/CopY family transcriptional regulator [Vicinamibacterales bacterium]